MCRPCQAEGGRGGPGASREGPEPQGPRLRLAAGAEPRAAGRSAPRLLVATHLPAGPHEALATLTLTLLSKAAAATPPRPFLTRLGYRASGSRRTCSGRGRSPRPLRLSRALRLGRGQASRGEDGPGHAGSLHRHLLQPRSPSSSPSFPWRMSAAEGAQGRERREPIALLVTFPAGWFPRTRRPLQILSRAGGAEGKPGNWAARSPAWVGPVLEPEGPAGGRRQAHGPTGASHRARTEETRRQAGLRAVAGHRAERGRVGER